MRKKNQIGEVRFKNYEDRCIWIFRSCIADTLPSDLSKNWFICIAQLLNFDLFL
jgi:hypothetical protein